MEWKVPPQMRLASSETSACTRSCISRAALFVKVSSRMDSGWMPLSSSQATRYVSVRVFPDPAPAMTSACPGGLVTAACCCSFSSAL